MPELSAIYDAIRRRAAEGKPPVSESRVAEINDLNKAIHAAAVRDLLGPTEAIIAACPICTRKEPLS